MKKDYVIYSLRIANILINKGFQLKGARVNFKNPKYMVYMFEDTAELRAALDRITNTI